MTMLNENKKWCIIATLIYTKTSRVFATPEEYKYQKLVQVNGVYDHEQVNILSWWNVTNVNHVFMD
jgi:hypothetical protein